MEANELPEEWKENRLLFDDVQLVRKLGQGGMGQVWLGKQLSWNQLVAVKQSLSADPQTLNALEKEADLWLEAGLHPYITTCYYTRRIDKQTIIVLEYARQGSLQQWIDNGQLYEGEPLYNMMRFGLQAAWGLTCAHKIGLLHLDVKPDNILIDDGKAKISDFGLSKAKGINNGLSGYTPRYAAPEQINGRATSNKTDVYCWAVSMMAMAAKGALWISGSVAEEVLKEYTREHLFFVPLPAALYDLLAPCFNKDPQKRPSMEQVGDRLQGIMKQLYPDKPIPDKLIDRQPLSSAEYNNRAVYLFEKGEKEEAMRYFRKAESMAMEIAVPKYNRMVAEFYNRTLTPGQMMETFQHAVLNPKQYKEKKISAQLMMLNGDLRNLQKKPEIAGTSAQVQAWIQKGASGHLRYTEPASPTYMNDGDEGKIHDILTKGRLDKGFFSLNQHIDFPLNSICSSQRKTYLFDNDKGAFLLGGVNSGEQPWLACVVRQEKYNLKGTFFMGEHAVFMAQAPQPVCYFKDPRNICFYHFPETPATRSLEYPMIKKYESLDDVCAISLSSRNKGYVVLILDISDGLSTDKLALIEDYQGGELLFRNDGSLRIDGRKIIEPNAWNGKKRQTDNPLGFTLPNNTDNPESKLLVNFGTEHLLIRHSPQFIEHKEPHKYPYICLWDYSPYKFLPTLFDSSPAAGLTFIFEYQGNLLTTRIDRSQENPPANPQWLMMKAVSGAIVSDRQELLSKLSKDYEALLTGKNYRNISQITEMLRPLVVQEDAQALALWKKIAQAFPAGKPFRAVQLEQDKTAWFEPVYSLKYPMPKYPGLSFSVQTSKGKVRYRYENPNRSYDNKLEPVMSCERYDGKTLAFKHFKDYPYATIATSSSDGMFHLLISETYRLGERATLYGFVIRILDVSRLEVIFEKELPNHIPTNTFTFWKGHTLFLYLDGLHAINLDQVDGKLTELPNPLIQNQVEMHNPLFFGEQADYFTSRHNTWYICSEILPLPENLYTDLRFTSIKNNLPFFKKNKRRMLLKEGLGEIWTNQLLK
jgi:serine/threonine protein kinase